MLRAEQIQPIQSLEYRRNWLLTLLHIAITLRELLLLYEPSVFNPTQCSVVYIICKGILRGRIKFVMGAKNKIMW